MVVVFPSPGGCHLSMPHSPLEAEAESGNESMIRTVSVMMSFSSATTFTERTQFYLSTE